MTIHFRTDRRGRRLAFREGGLASGRRLFRISLCEAELLIATGAAREAGR